MNPSELTDADFHEGQLIENIYARLKQARAGELERMLDSMSRHQPFLISLLAGFHKDVPIGAFNFIAETIAVIWEYFKDKPNIRKTPLTKSAYKAFERKNAVRLVEFSKMVAQDRTALIRNDWSNMRSKILFTMITGKLNDSPEIQELEKSTRGIILLGFTSVIEAMDNIVQREKA